MLQPSVLWPNRHFISLTDYSAGELRELLRLCAELKVRFLAGDRPRLLHGKTLAMLFQKPSNRTRVSFEVGLYQLGGHAIFIGPNEAQMGSRETPQDIALVLSRYVDAIMARTFSHQDVLTLAANASVPVINGLDDLFHPCQALADFLTMAEHFGGLESLPGLRVTYLGDGNNVCHSLVEGAARLGVHLTVGTPPGYKPNAAIWQKAVEVGATTGAKLTLTNDPQEAVADAQIVYTDTWTSMGQEDEHDLRLREFTGFQVNDVLLAGCPEAWVMHCLPAHYGEEITDSIAHGPRSLLWHQAENRLHAQKGVLVSVVPHAR